MDTKILSGSNRDSLGCTEKVSELMAAYLRYRRATVSPKTAQTDEYLFRYLTDFLQHYQGDAPHLRALMLEFIGHLRTLRKSPATLNAICERVRSMFNWAYEEGLIDAVPLRRREVIKRAEPCPNPLDESQVRALLRPLQRRTDWVSLRLRALLTVCIECGPRRAELLQMRVGDLRKGYSEVVQKGHRAHVMHLTTPALEACKQYLDAYQRQTGRKLKPEEPLWRSVAGLPLTADDLQKALRRYGRRVGIEPLNVHRLRKTCATLRLAYGASTEVVRRALGHSTDRVLRHYAGLSNKQQRDALELTSPTARILNKRKR